jgi:hypothetical protein
MIQPKPFVTLVSMSLVLIMAATPVTAVAQSDEVERELDQAKALYSEGRFADAIVKLRTVIVRLEELRDLESRKVQLADAHLLLGLAHLAMRREPDGVENFRQVVALDPGRRLDPEIFSPRVVALFERVRSEAVAASAEELPAIAPGTGAGNPTRVPEPLTPSSQLLPLLNAGTRVRLAVRAGQGVVRGNLVSMNDAAFTIVDPDNQQSLSFPRDMVTRVDVLHRRRSHYLRGGIAGAALGAVYGALETPGCEGNDGDCYTRGENIMYGSLGFGIVGALLGALHKTEEWVEVPLQPMASTSARGGKRVELSVVVASWE